MIRFISPISVAQAITGINAGVTFVQHTLLASFAIILFYLLPKSNSALGWSAVTRMLHSSIWPILLFSDSSQSNDAGAAVATLSYLSTLSTVLIAIVGVTLPLGLTQGPLLPTKPQVRVSANYVTDTSPLSLATTTGLAGFTHGRICSPNGTGIEAVPCPGQEDTHNTTYPSTLIDIFNSTRHSPFTMQYRRAYHSYPQLNISSGIISTPQPLLLRDDAFIVEGLVVDMSPGNFGIGFWNHTLPETSSGGIWSQDIMWLEPITQCVDTNLTVDYTGKGNISPVDYAANNPTNLGMDFDITDHGGFHSLPDDIPPLLRPSQQVDLASRAFRGAMLSNLYTMDYLNAKRESSFEGKSYRLGWSGDTPKSEVQAISNIAGVIGRVSALSLRYLNNTPPLIRSFNCSGYDPLLDNATLANVMVACAAFLGPPLRSDGGDPRIYDVGSRWHQRIHVCASATRASIHEVTFSVNNSKTMQDIQVTHRPSRNSVLWGVEKTDRNILSINPLWGRLADKYEGDPYHLWTLRDEYLYLPAGVSEGRIYFPAGEPLAAPNVIWEVVYASATGSGGLVDYSGISDYATQMKLLSLVESDPAAGYAHIRNAIWTDIMANNVVGSASNHTLMISPFQPTIEYDFRFAIPAFFLLMIWIPTFLASLFLLATRTVRFRYMKRVLNHTSVGRVVVGTALLQVEGKKAGTRLGHVLSSDLDHLISPHRLSMDDEARGDEASGDCKKSWASRFGATLASLKVDRHQDKGTVSDNPKSSP